MSATLAWLLAIGASGFAGGIGDGDGGEALPGTTFWRRPADPAAEMVAGLNRFFDAELAASPGRRPNPLEDPEGSRRALRRVLGIGHGLDGAEPVDREPGFEYAAGPGRDHRVGFGAGFEVRHVRWSAPRAGLTGEGLWLAPTEGGADKPARGLALAMGDADEPLERVAERAAVRAAAGFHVLIPALLDRGSERSGNPRIRMTNQSHREWIHRMAYEGGLTAAGLELEAAFAGLEALERATGSGPETPRLVEGRGEGARLALFAGALEARFGATIAGGGFEPREGVWSEPFDRHMWGLLERFGDAELAAMAASGGRLAVIDEAGAVRYGGAVPGGPGVANVAAAGRLEPPTSEAVASELARARRLSEVAGGGRIAGVPGAGPGRAGAAAEASRLLSEALGADAGGIAGEPEAVGGVATTWRREVTDGGLRSRRVSALEAAAQGHLRGANARREARWAGVSGASDAGARAEALSALRREFEEDLIGVCRPADAPLRAESAKRRDEPLWTGWDVRIPVWEGVDATGILLLPKDIRAGERRPAVVCQHGLEGRPEDVADPDRGGAPYHAFAARLAERGYVVFAPQNAYIFGEEFRRLTRKGHPLRQSLYGATIRQHGRILEWLASRPEVDGDRIGFYGLSYGGKCALRLPAVLEGYKVSVCSADFNEWAGKTTRTDFRASYMFTVEHDMYEFDLADRFNHAEMAMLIHPRPFMVERGRRDGVGIDEMVAWEQARAGRWYDEAGDGDRTGIEFFVGGHEILGRGTFAFLARWLEWPRGAAPMERGGRP